MVLGIYRGLSSQVTVCSHEEKRLYDAREETATAVSRVAEIEDIINGGASRGVPQGHRYSERIYRFFRLIHNWSYVS